MERKVCWVKYPGQFSFLRVDSTTWRKVQTEVLLEEFSTPTVLESTLGKNEIMDLIMNQNNFYFTTIIMSIYIFRFLAGHRFLILAALSILVLSFLCKRSLFQTSVLLIIFTAFIIVLVATGRSFVAPTARRLNLDSTLDQSKIEQ